MQTSHTEVIESVNLKIPWKPIPAGDTALVSLESDSTTALSVLHASEYVNGNGYYLYTETLKQRELCENENNKTNVINSVEKEEENFVIMSIWYWW